MRVVAGRLRGRRIHAAAGRGTRPTSDRARAGLADWLGPRFEGARALDLFAGTGALGIEALSRGAAHTTFVEQDRAAREALLQNLSELELELESRVLAGDVFRVLRRLAPGTFDLVFADPPWHGDLPERLLAERAFAPLLAPGGCAVIERSRREPVALACNGLRRVVSRAWGETRFDLYEFSEEKA